MNQETVIYIDGLNVFMRHFAANPSKSLNGNFCGGIVGFLRNIEHLTNKFKPKKIIVAWEGGGSVRRRNIDPNYKEGRRPVRLNRNSYYNDIPDTSENRNNQIKILVEILHNTPVTQIYVNDCEADDVIAYLVRKNKSDKNIIVTSDKDYYQLISNNTFIWSPNKKTLIDEEYIYENSGLPAYNYCLARCFSGDVSDGIKGVRGAGFKTLIKRFPDLILERESDINCIVSRAESLIKSGSNLKVLKEIVDNSKNLEKNWKLMYLDSAMLSSSQIKQINFQVENKEYNVNKFKILKTLNREGLNFFNVHSFIMVLKSSLRL